MDNVQHYSYLPDYISVPYSLELKSGKILSLPIPATINCMDCNNFTVCYPIEGLLKEKADIRYFCLDCISSYLSDGIEILNCADCPNVVAEKCLCWVCETVRNFDKQEARGKKPRGRKKRITPITNPFLLEK